MSFISLGSNIASIRAQRLLNANGTALGEVFARLSSGLRITRASDDAAGLAIASSLNKDARVFAQAIRNGNDAISALNIADGTLSQLSSVVGRLKELAESAANGTYGSAQRISMDQEAGALTNEFNRLVATTQFNGFSLLNGELTYLGVQLGYGVNGSIGIAVGSGLSRSAGTGGFGSDPTMIDYSLVAGSGLLNDLRTGDVNGDGRDDFLFSTASVVSVALSNGDGTFAAPTTVQTVLGATSIQFADFNGDGRLDVMSSSLAGGSVNVSLGNGNGTFKAVSTVASGVALGNFGRTGDVDGDGRVDIITTGASGGLGVLLGNGDGTFKTAIANTYGVAAANLTLADINNDGKLDAAIGGSVLYGNGNGTFKTSVAVSGVTSVAQFFDVNRDGIVDSLISTGVNLNVRLGNGDGSFKALTAYATGASGKAVFGDFNNDGQLDATISGASTATIFGNADGSFGNVVTSTSLTPYASLVSGDFNGDGVLDIGGGNSGDTNLYAIIQQTQNTTTTERFDLTTQSKARQALTLMDAVMNRIQKEQGIVGAGMSRIGFALSTLSSLAENSTAAAGRILNADIAADSAEMVRRQILQQSAAAVLAQANQQPAIALMLLRQ